MLKIDLKIKIFILLLVIIGLILRLVNFSYYPLWADELAVLAHGREDLKYLIYYTFKQSYHHPMYYFILKVWLKIIPEFGEWIRGINLIFSTGLMLLPIYFFKERTTKVLFLLFLGTTAHLVIWANTLTNYMSSIFFLALYVCSYICFYKNENKVNFRRLLITSFFGIYFSFFSSLYILLLSFLLLIPLYKRKSKFFKKYVLASSLNAFIYALYFLNSGLFNFVKEPSGTVFWNNSISSIGEINKLIDYYFYDLSLFIIVLCMTIILLLKKKVKFLPIVFLGSSVALSFVKVAKSFFYHSLIIERYFLYDFFIFSVGFLLLTPKKLTRLNQVIIIMFFSILSLNYLNDKIIIKYQDFESPLTYFYENSNRTEKLGYIGYNYKHLIFYFEKYKLQNRYFIVVEDTKCSSKDELEEKLLTFLKANRFLLIRSDGACNKVMQKVLDESRLKLLEMHEFSGVNLYEFEKSL